MKLKNIESRKTAVCLINSIVEIYLLDEQNFDPVSRSEFSSTIGAFYNGAIGESVVKGTLIIKLINKIEALTNKIIKEQAIRSLLSFIKDWQEEPSFIAPEIVKFATANGSTINETSKRDS